MISGIDRIRNEAAHPALLDIDVANHVHPIPRTIFGGFLEPLRTAINQGLSAQILENPSFEEGLWSAEALAVLLAERTELAGASRIGLPVPWESLDAAQGWRFEPRWDDVYNSCRSLMIMGLPTQETGVRQRVYLPVHRTLTYQGSLYAKPLSGSRQLQVSMRPRNRREDRLAHHSIHLSDDDWTRYEFSLDLPPNRIASLEAADFVISVEDDTRILIDQATLFPSDTIDGLNPEMVALTRSLNLPLLRFGGNLSSGYHWKEAVGPMDKRVSMLNRAWGSPDYNNFGTDEFLRFCELVGTQPQFCLNLGSGTPEEAAEWVQYVNARWGDKSGGLLWEVGNEQYGTWQIGYPPVEKIAARTKAFVDAVRKVDPKVRLIATGHKELWNAQLYTLPPGTFDYVSEHFVITPVPAASARQPYQTDEYIALHTLAHSLTVEAQMRAYKRQADAEPNTEGRMRFAITEWLYRTDWEPVPHEIVTAHAPDYQNHGGALCAANFLNMLMRNADIMPIANCTSLVEFGRIWNRRGVVYAPPCYYAFRMYANADVATLVKIQTSCASYVLEGDHASAPQSVPVLDTAAALNKQGDCLTLFVVNRSLSEEVPATVRLGHFTAAVVTGQQLTASSIYAENSEENPQAIVPHPITAQLATGVLPYIFPPASITLLEFRSKG